MGKAICILDPSYVKNRAPEDLHLGRGGWKSVRDRSPRTPLRTPRTLRIGGCSISKNNGRHAAFEEELERWISRGRRSTREMSIRDVRRSGRWFPESGLHFGASDLQVCQDDFVWQVQHFVWPGITFLKNRKAHWYEAVSSALNFPFWRTSRRIVSFLMLSTSNWGSLAELFRFWRCQAQKLRKPRRIALFSCSQKER